jgi:hypothetical protein
MPESMSGDDTLGGQKGSDRQYTHRNKRLITLNLNEPEVIALLKQLIAKADMVVENFGYPDFDVGLIKSAPTRSARSVLECGLQSCVQPRSHRVGSRPLET